MNRWPRLLALLSVLLLLAAACGDDDQAADAPPPAADDDVVAPDAADPDAEGEAPGREDADLVIWADGDRTAPLREIGERMAEAEGISVAVQEVQFDDLRGQLQTAGPAGEGPDIILGAHDWIGELVTNGAVAPVDLQNPDDFLDVSIDAFTWEGQLYGLPYAIENIALFRNTDLVPEEPETWEDVRETALELQEAGEVRQGFVIPAAAAESPYHNQPLFTAMGGYVFAQEEDGTYDTSDVGIDSDDALEAAEQFAEWAQEGFINPDVDGPLMQEIFGNGEAAFAITGPWALVQDGSGFEETGVPFEVTPVPPVDGGNPQPFVGVQGVMISAFSENALLAQTFVNNYMTTTEAQMTLFEANPRPPALIEAFDQVTAEYPAFEAFGEAGAEGQPMPAVPAMSTVFSAMGDAYDLVYRGAADPREAFSNAAQQVRSAVGAE
jgi:arabinogalactan oligomer / maltooligosaccharide transport system substrate-binding protein